MSKVYTFIDSSVNKRLFADVSNRRSTLSVSANSATAGTKDKAIDIMRASVNLTEPRYLQPTGCEDACNPVLVTNKAEIIISGAFVDHVALKAHLDEAVRCTVLAWTGYKLKDGFLPPINADFADQVTP